jgi:hypothetical protein
MANNPHILSRIERYINENSDAVKVKIDDELIIYYIITMVNIHLIVNNLEKVYYYSRSSFDRYINTVSSKFNNDKDLFDLLSKGYIIAHYKGELYYIGMTEERKSRQIQEVMRESVHEGALSGFVENITTNLNLLRQYYPREGLTVKEYQIGYVGNNKVYLIYDRQYCDMNIVKEIKKRLECSNYPIIQASGELQQIILDKQWLVPRLLTTERFDRAVRSLGEGRVVILLDGSPSATIAPTTFNDFFDSMESSFLLPLQSIFLNILKYIALFLSLLLPSLYVAIASYNSEVLRFQIVLSIAVSRRGVPYPSFIEVLFALVLMEFLVEASLRLSKGIGQSAAIIGGIILGLAAIQAHLVSNVVIIIIAVVAISNFVIPITSMNLSVRVAKYILLLITSIGGFFGLLAGFTALICYLFSLHSFGKPFFNPLGAHRSTGFKVFGRKGQLK